MNKKLLISLLAALLLATLACSFSSSKEEESPPTKQNVSSPTPSLTPKPSFTPTKSITATPELSADSDVLFQDDFSDTSGNWRKIKEGNGSKADYKDSGYQIFVNDPAYFLWSVSQNKFTGGIRVDADVTYQDGASEGSVGLVCRYTRKENQESFYALVVGNNATLIIKVDGGDVNVLANDVYDGEILNGDTLHLRADCNGKTLAFYVNGKKILGTVDNTPLPEGDIGITAGTALEQTGTDALFDNIVVRRLDEAGIISTSDPSQMLIGVSGEDAVLAGENWLYKKDRKDNTYACITYIKDEENSAWVEQCFIDAQLGIAIEDFFTPYIQDGYLPITPNNTFDDVGRVRIMAKYTEDEPTGFIRSIEIIDVNGYIFSAEMAMITDNTAELQELYNEKLAEIMNFLLQDSLQKAKFFPRPAPTPLSPSEDRTYQELGDIILTTEEANALYQVPLMGFGTLIDGRWTAIGDVVAAEPQIVCRDFEDRTNADVQWVSFTNCVIEFDDTQFENYINSIKDEESITLTSQYQYEGDLRIFGYQEGHSSIFTVLKQGKYVYYIWMESRALAGQSLQDIYDAGMDDFIHQVLLTNLEHTAP